MTVVTDVDYTIYKNTETGTHHLAVTPSEMTACGIKTKAKDYYVRSILPMKKFWRLRNRCKNCERAAKR